MVSRVSGAVGEIASAEVVTWTSLGEAARVVANRNHLVRTVSVALVVGTILFSINQLDVVMTGDATTATWVKSVTTYLVPFCVANYGVLTATRRRSLPSGSPTPPRGSVPSDG